MGSAETGWDGVKTTNARWERGHISVPVSLCSVSIASEGGFVIYIYDAQS